MKITFGQLIGLIVLVVIIGVGAYIGTTKLKQRAADGGKTRQAVFLSNGEVYFGYASHVNSPTVILQNVYSLHADTTQNKDTKATDATQKLSLVKIGDQLHGPTDEIKINHTFILYIEDLKGDSKVNQVIADSIKNGTATPEPAVSPTVKP